MERSTTDYTTDLFAEPDLILSCLRVAAVSML